MPSPHRIFSIEDIVLEILKLLYRSDLVHFSQTCRFIWLLALPSIWRDVPRLSILESLTETSHVETAIGEPLKVRTMTWQRLDCYTPHIRSLSLSDRAVKYSTDYDAVTMMALLRTMSILAAYRESKDSKFLPRLQSLHLELSSSDSIRAAMCLLHNPLSRISIDIHMEGSRSHSAVQQLMELLAREANALEDLSFDLVRRLDDMDEVDAPLRTPFFNLMSRLTSVERVQLCAIHDKSSIMLALASLPFLESLCIGRGDLDVEEAEIEGAFALPSSSFPALTELHIRSFWSASYYVSLLQQITCPHLSTFSMVCVDLSICSEINRCLASRWSSTLRSAEYREETSEGPSSLQLGNLVEHLLDCRGLECFQVTVVGDGATLLHIPDDDYSKITLAWPHLRRLGIEVDGHDWLSDGETADDPDSTRQSLVYFATRCPELRSLTISIDFDLPSDLELICSTSSLEYLHLAYSTSRRPEEANVFLRRLFPNITNIEVASYDKEVQTVTDIPLDGMEELQEFLNMSDSDSWKTIGSDEEMEIDEVIYTSGE